MMLSISMASSSEDVSLHVDVGRRTGVYPLEKLGREGDWSRRSCSESGRRGGVGKSVDKSWIDISFVVMTGELWRTSRVLAVGSEGRLRAFVRDGEDELG